MLFSSCAKIDDTSSEWVYKERPMMLFVDTTILDLHQGSELKWQVKTAYLERSRSGAVFARPVFAHAYDSTGARIAYLRCDSARFDMRMTYARAYGHVYALTPEGASVRADSLVWAKRGNLVRTEGPVRVVSMDGDVLSGTGFESDPKLENWRILSNVSGIFQEAADRLKEEDKKAGE
jgi:hypothetical protein